MPLINNAPGRGCTTKKLPVKRQGWFYGFFSEKGSEHGSCIYRGEKGIKIEVTEVSRYPDHKSKWEDISFVGMVEEFGFLERREGIYV